MFETVPLLLNIGGQVQTGLQTDNRAGHVLINTAIDNRILGERICFMISSELIQPNPLVIHEAIEESPAWVEILFARIYRCPSSGIILRKPIEFQGETHYVIDADEVVDLRKFDPVAVADGNDAAALSTLLMDGFLS